MFHVFKGTPKIIFYILIFPKSRSPIKLFGKTLISWREDNKLLLSNNSS